VLEPPPYCREGVALIDACATGHQHGIQQYFRCLVLGKSDSDHNAPEGACHSSKRVALAAVRSLSTLRMIVLIKA
jgi:hypothetical protein